MNPAADIGNMEPTWFDVESGPAGIIGQNKPMVAKSLTAMNRMFKSEEFRELYGKQKDSRWFNKRFSFAGILRHNERKQNQEREGEVEVHGARGWGVCARLVFEWVYMGVN
jgi:hypothetical protein